MFTGGATEERGRADIALVSPACVYISRGGFLSIFFPFFLSFVAKRNRRKRATWTKETQTGEKEENKTGEIELPDSDIWFLRFALDSRHALVGELSGVSRGRLESLSRDDADRDPFQSPNRGLGSNGGTFRVVPKKGLDEVGYAASRGESQIDTKRAVRVGVRTRLSIVFGSPKESRRRVATLEHSPKWSSRDDVPWRTLIHHPRRRRNIRRTRRRRTTRPRRRRIHCISLSQKGDATKNTPLWVKFHTKTRTHGGKIQTRRQARATTREKSPSGERAPRATHKRKTKEETKRRRRRFFFLSSKRY